MNNQLRIIAGKWKRRQLDFANVDGLRPTPDRVRETLFNWLMWDIQNADVLDVCAGSGALSFEALSRGANSVLMIEPNREQTAFLQKNLKLLQVENATLMVTTAQKALNQLAQSAQRFDVVFLDPPYSLNLWQELAMLIQPVLKQKALIYVEADRELHQLNLPNTWKIIKQSKAGKVYAGLFQVQM